MEKPLRVAVAVLASSSSSPLSQPNTHHHQRNSTYKAVKSKEKIWYEWIQDVRVPSKEEKPEGKQSNPQEKKPISAHTWQRRVTSGFHHPSPTLWLVRFPSPSPPVRLPLNLHFAGLALICFPITLFNSFLRDLVRVLGSKRKSSGPALSRTQITSRMIQSPNMSISNMAKRPVSASVSVGYFVLGLGSLCSSNIPQPLSFRRWERSTQVQSVPTLLLIKRWLYCSDDSCRDPIQPSGSLGRADDM